MYRIRELRREKGLTQEALAAKCGNTQATISLIESGRSTTVRTLQAIADVLECDVPDLFVPRTVEAEPVLAEAVQ